MKKNQKWLICIKRWIKSSNLMFLILLIAGGFLFFIAFVPNNPAISHDSENLESYNDGWMLLPEGREITLPCQIDSEADEEIIISKQIKQHYNKDQTFFISFISSWQSVQVFVEDTLIYEYYQEESRFYEVSPPPYYHIISITPDMFGKTISIAYHSPMDHYSGVLNAITMGSEFELIHDYMNTGFQSFLLCFAIFILGLLVLVLSFFMKKKLGTSDRLIYLGIFSILVSVWLGCETRLIQFIMHDPQLNIFITLFCVMILPIPLLLFFRHNHTGRIKKIYEGLSYLFILHFIIRLILQVTSVYGIYRAFGYYILSCGFVLFWIAGTSIYLYCRQKKRQNFLLMLAVITLFIFAGIDIFRFLSGDTIFTNSNDALIFFRIGIFFFICILADSIIEEMMNYYQENIKAAAYKELAYTDSLSQLKNRNYLLERYPDLFKEAMKKKSSIAFIMIDIDNFKKYNDHYGHLLGDEVIFEISKVIGRTVVRPLDAAIRYGGEEFLIIMPETTEEGAALISEEVACGIKQLNLQHAYSEISSVITVSQGIYCGIPNREDTLECYMQKADDALYQAKEAGKNQIRIYHK